MSTNCKWVVENTVQSFSLSICSLPQYISLALYFQYPLPVQIHSLAYTLSDFWVLYFIPVPWQLHSLGKQMIKFPSLGQRQMALEKFPLTQIQLMEISWKQITSIYPKFHCLFKCLANAAGLLTMGSHLVERLMLLWIFSSVIQFVDRLHNEISWIMRSNKLF